MNFKEEDMHSLEFQLLTSLINVVRYHDAHCEQPDDCGVNLYDLRNIAKRLAEQAPQHEQANLKFMISTMPGRNPA
jgi:hypothetical protein